MLLCQPHKLKLFTTISGIDTCTVHIPPKHLKAVDHSVFEFICLPRCLACGSLIQLPIGCPCLTVHTSVSVVRLKSPKDQTVKKCPSVESLTRIISGTCSWTSGYTPSQILKCLSRYQNIKGKCYTRIGYKKIQAVIVVRWINYIVQRGRISDSDNLCFQVLYTPNNSSTLEA